MTSASNSEIASPSANLDPTFRQYNPQQATSYSDNRGSYSRSLVDEIIEYHASHNPQASLDTLLDVGCGPGNATRTVAAHFNHATGVDPGIEMIARATSIGGSTQSGNQITFEVAAAEELDTAQSVAAGSVDVLTAAMAAHWFRMGRFWPQAAKMLKAGGTVALWTKSSLYCHPSTPNAVTVQNILTNLEDGLRVTHELPSNRLSRDMYIDLALPWTVEPLCPDFSPELFERRVWNCDGKLEAGANDFFGGSEEITLAQLAMGLGTSSMVTRWRESNPELAGTDKDCVVVALKEVAKAMGQDEAGKETGIRHGPDSKIRIGAATVLLLLSRN